MSAHGVQYPFSPVSEGGISSFEQTYQDWKQGDLTQEDAARLLGISTRTFRRYVTRYEADGLSDRRKTQASPRRAPPDEARRLVKQYRRSHQGRSVRQFHAWYSRGGGTRSYAWVKNTLQAAGVVEKATRGRARLKPASMPGMLLHQDGRMYEWAPDRYWSLIITLDDATNEHYSLFFCEAEGTHSSFRGVREVIEAHGLFHSLCTDRARHYWHSHQAGGRARQADLTQFGQAMKQLGIEMIPAYSRAERRRTVQAFAEHRRRLPAELAAAGITDMDAANTWLRDTYLPAFNAEFAHAPGKEGLAFTPYPASLALDDILCERFERSISRGNRVRFGGRVLQVPAEQRRDHYTRSRVQVCRYTDGSLGLFQGPLRLARYDAEGRVIHEEAPPAG